MKKGLLAVVASLILVSTPVLSGAQGLLPGLPGGWFGTGAYGQAPYGSSFLDPLSFYVGYGDSFGDTRFAFDGGATVSGLQHKWPVRGIWLGVSEKAKFSETSAVAVEAWWLIPTNAPGTESEGFSTIVNIGSGTTPIFITVNGPAGLGWDTRPDWWFIDGRLLCTPFASNSMFIAGFRYDHFSTRFQFPSGAFGGLAFGGGDTADVTVNSYIPYVGMEYSARASGGSNLLVRVLGFPWVPAQVQHYESAGAGTRAESNGNFTERGYFVEAFGEYNWNVFAGSTLGAFARWNYLAGRGNIDTKLVPTSVSNSDKFGFNRNQVTFGAKISIDFGLPY